MCENKKSRRHSRSKRRKSTYGETRVSPFNSSVCLVLDSSVNTSSTMRTLTHYPPVLLDAIVKRDKIELIYKRDPLYSPHETQVYKKDIYYWRHGEMKCKTVFGVFHPACSESYSFE